MADRNARTPGIGLATIRKEGSLSVLGLRSGDVLVTRQIRWPGGNLLVNADAREGELKVRVTDARRKVLAGFDYDDCVAISSDNVAHKMSWRGASLDALAGEFIRLEFLLKNSHLYSMRASGE